MTGEDDDVMVNDMGYLWLLAYRLMDEAAQLKPELIEFPLTLGFIHDWMRRLRILQMIADHEYTFYIDPWPVDRAELMIANWEAGYETF